MIGLTDEVKGTGVWRQFTLTREKSEEKKEDEKEVDAPKEDEKKQDPKQGK